MEYEQDFIRLLVISQSIDELLETYCTLLNY